MNNRKSVCFFHIATMGHYEEVNKEMLTTLLESGLLDKLEKLYLCVMGENPLNLPFNHPSFEIVDLGKDLSLFEYPKLEHLELFARANSNYNILYLCNAGVSHNKNENDYYPGWRQLMMHFCVTEWENVFKVLDTYDTCGIEWQDDPSGHFSGNFWWVTSEHVKKMPTVEEAKNYTSVINFGTYRHGAEFWIGMNKDVKHKSLFDTGYSWRDRPIINWYEKVIN